MKNDIMNSMEPEEKIRLAEEERNTIADDLVDAYQNQKAIVGDKNKWISSYNKNPRAIRRTALALKNQELSFKKLQEAQVTSAFPISLQSLLKVVRIVVANLVYPEIYTNIIGQRWNEVIYFIDTITNAVGSPARGDSGVKMYENNNFRRIPTEIERKEITGVQISTDYTMDVTPLRPRKVYIYDTVLNIVVAIDDGIGNIVDPFTSTIAGTVVYATGVVRFSNIGTLTNIAVEYNFDSENSNNFGQISDVELRVRPVQFYYEPRYTGVSWSKMAELQLRGTFDQDIDALLTDGAIQLLKVSADQVALSFGYDYARRQTAVNWSADYVASGALSIKDHLDSFSYALNRISSQIYDINNRGVINKIYGCSAPIALLKSHRNFVPEGAQDPEGCFKVGKIDNIEIYQVPTKVMLRTGDAESVNDLVCNFKNPKIESDTSIIFSDYVPIASQTMTLEYKNLTSEKGIYSVSDRQVVNKSFLGRIRVKNIPNI